MPEFYYQGVDAQGRKQEGREWASHEGDFRKKLRTQGLRPLKISRFSFFLWLQSKPPSQKSVEEDLVWLGCMLRSGLTLPAAVEILRGSQNTPFWSKIQMTLLRDPDLGNAFRLFPYLFPKYACTLLTTGQATNRIEEALETVTRFFLRDRQLRQTLFWTALLGSSSWFFLCLWITLQYHTFWAFLNSFALGGILWYWQRTQEGKEKTSRLVLKMPGVTSFCWARFYGAFSLFLKFEQDPLTALLNCQSSLGYSPLEGTLSQVIRTLKRASPESHAFLLKPLFPFLGKNLQITAEEMAKYKTDQGFLALSYWKKGLTFLWFLLLFFVPFFFL